MRRFAAILLRSFFQGLLLLSPIALTAYIIFMVFDKIDSLIPFVPRGVGFISIITVITIIGYLGTRIFIGRWLFDAFEYIFEHTPGVKFIYSSIRDILGSFVGDKKKFNRPVWVRVNTSPEIWRIGFLTQKEINFEHMDGKVAVYMPHSYAISGWVIVVDMENVRKIEDMTAAEAMKFAVSGGVTISEDEPKKHH